MGVWTVSTILAAVVSGLLTGYAFTFAMYRWPEVPSGLADDGWRLIVLVMVPLGTVFYIFQAAAEFYEGTSVELVGRFLARAVLFLVFVAMAAIGAQIGAATTRPNDGGKP